MPDFEEDLAALLGQSKDNGNFIVYRVLDCTFWHPCQKCFLLFVLLMFLINKICALKQNLQYMHIHNYVYHVCASVYVYVLDYKQERIMEGNVLTYFTATMVSPDDDGFDLPSKKVLHAYG